jgi:two-component sensor histidine kinase
LDLRSTEVPVDLAVPLGLIANELITNALKHAFPGRPQEGRIVVKFESIDTRSYVLEIADSGAGLAPQQVEPNDAPAGIGMRLVRRLAQQVQGKIEIGVREGGGTRCRVTVQAHEQPA